MEEETKTEQPPIALTPISDIGAAQPLTPETAGPGGVLIEPKGDGLDKAETTRSWTARGLLITVSERIADAAIISCEMRAAGPGDERIVEGPGTWTMSVGDARVVVNLSGAEDAKPIDTSAVQPIAIAPATPQAETIVIEPVALTPAPEPVVSIAPRREIKTPSRLSIPLGMFEALASYAATGPSGMPEVFAEWQRFLSRRGLGRAAIAGSVTAAMQSLMRLRNPIAAALEEEKRVQRK